MDVTTRWNRFRASMMSPVRILVPFIVLGLSAPVFAQGDGARFYWKGLSGTNAIPLIMSSLGGNANPFDPTNYVVPGSEFSGTMIMAGYARLLPLFDRSAIVSVIVPMGRLSSDVSLNGKDVTATARGFGDPMLQLDLNIIGPKAIKNLPDMLRYEPGFSVDLMASLAIPIGQYDSESPINIGQNRWYGRIGMPVIWQIGQWIPGERTTIELLPAAWLFADNPDFMGSKMSTKPKYQLEAHITRDFMERAWGSIDVISYLGGATTVDSTVGESLNNIGVGATVGYHLNDNMNITIAYSVTVNDTEPGDLNMDSFRIGLSYGWNSLIEGMRRLKGND